MRVNVPITKKMFKALAYYDAHPIYGYLHGPSHIVDQDNDLICIIPGSAKQYIGWTDSHGDPIFEGDVVEYLDDGEIKIREIHNMEDAEFMDDIIVLYYHKDSMTVSDYT